VTSLLRLPLLLLVLVYQSIVLALTQIWANKMRSALTTIGIIIGVASVTAVIAALTGLKTNVLSEFESFGTNKVFIGPDRPQQGPKRNASWTVLRFQPELFNGMLDHCPSLKALTRISRSAETVSFGERVLQSVEIFGIEPAWHDIERRSVTMGRPFSAIDNAQGRPVCLITEKLQRKLALDRDPTGQSILLANRRFLVIGVVEPQPALFGSEGEGLEVFVPFKLLYNKIPNGMPLWVMAASRSPDVSEEAKAEATFFLRRQRRLEPGEPNTFRVEFVAQFVEQFSAVASAITIVATGIVGVSLLVGGVGIMNIMLVSVSERTREIGLRKAVGARPAAILLQFLVEAVILCVMGGLLGLVIGQALTMIMAAIPAAKLDKAYIPGWAIALSVGFSAFVGLLFGMFPAIKAARLDPIEALRHE
jgi:putative ABC transport system permease protein